MTTRVLSLLVALWGAFAPAALAAAPEGEVESCCGDAAPTCCCCEEVDDGAGEGPAVREPSGCPCSSPLDPEAPPAPPALPATADVKPALDVAPSSAAPPIAATVGPSLRLSPWTTGVPPPGVPRPVLLCSFRF